MLQPIVGDNNLHIMRCQNRFHRRGAFRRYRDRRAGPLINQYRFISRFCGCRLRRQEQRISGSFPAVAAGNDPHAHATLLQLFHQPNDYGGFTVTASRKIPYHNHRYRRSPGAFKTKLIAQTNRPAHQAIQPGERQQ
ncbi:Uncharacterised protein [Salmonella enterica subsp. enterica serovar Typhimurium str. DT104]|nr:Uncharacterised protein [Salmonella enterica subsp. enterica serovar Typhimurium str. DT104]CQK92672.1 Uncharacterised protein [Salmonella enterica subsp. enterica serovar Typhimurium str. DT104]